MTDSRRHVDAVMTGLHNFRGILFIDGIPILKDMRVWPTRIEAIRKMKEALYGE